MAKCANCGEINPDNAGFCFSCGKAFNKNEPSPAEIAYENAKKEFDNNARASIDRSKITYVCELCGTINRIDSPRCVRCGKPRPRSEFIAALKGIKNAQAIQEPEEEPVAASVAEPQAPIEDKPEVQENNNQTIYRYEPAPASAQTPQVVQPFVIVPYVNTAEKLWQYNPRQIYRFQPYSAAEKLGIEEASSDEAANRTIEELIALRNKKQSELARINGELKSSSSKDNQNTVRSNKYQKVRSAAFFSLLFSVLFVAALFIAPIFGSSKLFEGLDIFKFLFVCIGGAFNINLGISSTLVYDGWKDFLLPAGYWIALIFAVIIAIRSIVRLVKGTAKTKGFFLPLIAFAAVLVSAAGLFLDFGTDLFSLNYGLYIVAGLSAALFLTGIFGAKNSKNS